MADQIEEFVSEQDFQKKYLDPFRPLYSVYWPEKGFIVWRFATGENVELLHIRTFVRGKGYSRELVKEMLAQLKDHPPYYSVFGFALSSRTALKEVYPKLGFSISEDIPGPYKGGPSFMFWQSYEELCKRYGV